MAARPTVKIKAENRWGYKIIAADDFDPARHVLLDPIPKQPVKRGKKKEAEA